MAMNKSEQETYNRALEIGKKYEKLYTDLHNKSENFKSYLRVRISILEENIKYFHTDNFADLSDYEKLITKEYQIYKEISNYLLDK